MVKRKSQAKGMTRKLKVLRQEMKARQRVPSHNASRLIDGVSPDDASDEIHLGALLRTLWRRRFVLFTTVIAITGSAALYVNQLTPRYSAEALVMIETRGLQIVELNEVIPALTADMATIETQVEILQSRNLASRVIERLGLIDDPEFNPALLPESPKFLTYLNPLRYFPQEWKDVLLRSPNEPIHSQDAQLQQWRDHIVDIFRTNLSVSPVGRSYTISIRYESENPTRTAQIATTIAELYLAEQLEAKYEATGRATTFLNHRLGDLRQKVIESENEVKIYQESVTRIDSLMNQEIVLMDTEANLSIRYGDKHPEIINVRTELSNVRRKIEREIELVAQRPANEIEVETAREAGLQDRLNTVRRQVAEPEVRLRQLEREAEATRVLYETFLTRFAEMTEQETLLRPDARIISLPSISIEPSYPMKARMVGTAFVGSAFLSVLIIILLEKLEIGFRSAEELEKISGNPVLTIIPTVQNPRKSISVDGTSAFREAVTTLRNGLALSNHEGRPKVVLITSAVPREGKTVLATSLALQVAKLGHKCLLIDCDLQRSKFHPLPRVQIKPGLSDLLAGTKSLEEVVRTECSSGLDFIDPGFKSPSAPDFLSLQRISDLLSRLEKRYELIVLDSPPVLMVSDARLLSRIADTTIFVVRWARTRRNTVLAGLKQILEDGTEVMGLVLTRVNTRKYANYGFAHSDIYSAGYGYGHRRVGRVGELGRNELVAIVGADAGIPPRFAPLPATLPLEGEINGKIQLTEGESACLERLFRSGTSLSELVDVRARSSGYPAGPQGTRRRLLTPGRTPERIAPPRDFEVGYGKPPNDTRFKKGQSGNPKGRPKGAKNLKNKLKEEFQEKIVVREGDTTRLP